MSDPKNLASLVPPLDLTPRVATLLQLWTKIPENLETGTIDQIQVLLESTCHTTVLVSKTVHFTYLSYYLFSIPYKTKSHTHKVLT